MISIFGWSFSLRVRVQKKATPPAVNEALQKRVLKTYSQFNEDIFLGQIFAGHDNGYYVDIGANDPVRLSNTKKFFDLGWTGINVEPNPHLYKRICEHRPEDINLNCGVGDVRGEMTFYEIDPDCYSTFDPAVAKKTRYSSSKKVMSELPVKIITINDIFELCTRPVDLLSVDTESYDYKVLSANDWRRNRPRVIVVELDHDDNGAVCNLLRRQNYELIYFNGTNGIFIEEEFSATFVQGEAEVP